MSDAEHTPPADQVGTMPLPTHLKPECLLRLRLAASEEGRCRAEHDLARLGVQRAEDALRTALREWAEVAAYLKTAYSMTDDDKVEPDGRIVRVN